VGIYMLDLSRVIAAAANRASHFVVVRQPISVSG
jgi:hypothetical protein